MYSFIRRELARLPTPLPPSRLLGKFVEAAKDLRTACKIDFDDTADEWLKEVTPNVSEPWSHTYDVCRGVFQLCEFDIYLLYRGKGSQILPTSLPMIRACAACFPLSLLFIYCTPVS